MILARHSCVPWESIGDRCVMFVTTCTHGEVLGQCQGYWCDHTYCKSLAGTHHLKEGNSHCNCLLRGSHTHCPPVYVSVTRLDWEGKVWNRIAHSVIPIQLFASLWPQKCCEQCVTVRQEEHKCKSAQVFLWHRNSLEHARRNVFRAQHRLKHRCLKWEQLSSLGLLALKMCFSYSTAQHK